MIFFQTMNSFRSNSLCLKYERFTPSAGKDIEIRKFIICGKNSVPFEFVQGNQADTDQVSTISV